MRTGICFIVNAAAGGQEGAAVASALPHLLAKFGLTCAVRLIRNGSEVHNEAERALQSGFRHNRRSRRRWYCQRRGVSSPWYG